VSLANSILREMQAGQASCRTTEIPSVMKHQQESKLRPELLVHITAARRREEFQVPQEGWFLSTVGQHCPPRNAQSEQDSPCDYLLLKPGCVHMEYILHVELLKKLLFPYKRRRNNMFI